MKYLLMFALAWVPHRTPVRVPTPTPIIEVAPVLSPFESALIADINFYRTSKGLPQVHPTTQTCDLATLRLKQTLTDFSHAQFYQVTQPGYWFENLARYYSDPAATLDGWISSPTHNANLLSKMTEMCIRTDGTYWVLEGHKAL